MNRATTLFLTTLLLLIGSSSFTAAYAQQGTVYERSFVHNDSLRTYLLYVPATYDGTKNWPLVIDYHGYSIDAAFQMAVDRMDLAADEAHFLLAYPNGLIADSPFDGPGLGWNFDGMASPNDDVDFTSKLIDHVMEDFRVDPTRVHATGWSMGSAMTWGVACGLSDRIASVAGVSSPMDDASIQACDAGRPISAMLIQGTDDPFFPPEGVEANGYVFSSPGQTPAFWARKNNCSPDPMATELEDVDATDNSTVTLFEYAGCDDGTEVRYYRVNGGGHPWPGGSWPGGGSPPGFLNPMNRDLNASAEILDFFRRNPMPGTLEERSFVHNDSLRTYLLYVPAAYDGTATWPLVINYHGFSNSAEDQVAISQMNAVADTAKFLIAYPQGLMVNNPFLNVPGTGWNLIGGTLSMNDDVDFSLALIDHVQEDYMIDEDRIHVTGWSMGAGMAYEMACAHPEKIASFAAVAEQMDDGTLGSCNPDYPRSFLQIHGTADPIVPFDGVEAGGIAFSPAPETASFWAGLNNCSPDSMITEMADVVAEDNSTVTLVQYEGCDNDTEVRFYQINGGGHAWPGGGALPDFLGAVNRDINASAEILDFFRSNPMPEGGTVYERSFVHDGVSRSYLLYVPAAYDGTTEWPLVLNYHGLLTNSRFQIELSEMNTVADTAHFLVAYPLGLTVSVPGFPVGLGWNIPGFMAQQDDVDFTDRLVDHVNTDFKIDRRRIHATGWSNGSVMSFYLACERPDLIASVAGVAAPMSDAMLESCVYQRPVSSLLIHGTADPIVPFEGIPELFASAPTTPSYWATQFNCAQDSVVVDLPDLVTSDSSTVTLIEYGNCDGDAEVLFYQVNNGGHTWPGGGTPTAPAPLGHVNRDFNASAEIWNFFKRHPLPRPTSIEQEEPASFESGIHVEVYPNPFVEQLTLDLTLPRTSKVKLTVVNILGQKVGTIVEQTLPGGQQRIAWKVADSGLASGVYFLRLNVGDQWVTKPILHVAK